MKKILVSLIVAAGIVSLAGLSHAIGQGSVIWADAITSTSSTAIYPLGTLRQAEATDSTGFKEYVYGHFWCNPNDTVQIGSVLYDTTGTGAAYNFTNISPDTVGLFGADTLGIIDSSATGLKCYARNSVAGVSVGTHLRGEFGWVQIRGLANVRMVAPQAKAHVLTWDGSSNGYSLRYYRAGTTICGAPPGVHRVAYVPGVVTPNAAALAFQNIGGPKLSYQSWAQPFGHIAITAAQDTTLVKAYINCKF